MVKFDSLLNIESIYEIEYRRGRFYCPCPAGNKPTCRHRDMISKFNTHKAVDSWKFLCYETHTFCEPIRRMYD